MALRRPVGRVIDPLDTVLRYRGAVSLEPVGGAVAPWRLPYTERELYLPTGGVGRGAMTAGVRVTFRTNSPWLRCQYTATPPPKLNGPQERATADVVCDGQLCATVELETGGLATELCVEGLGSRMKTVELWLPCYSQFRLCWLEVARDCVVVRDLDELPRWVHYGSSISQGRGAESPSRAWTARVARAASLDLLSLSLGAGCHVQPLFGTLLRDLPADLITCCVGINTYGLASLNEHSFQPNLIGFLRLIRERHATTPLVVMSSIYAPRREDSAHTGTLTLREFREHTRTAVAALRRHGDTEIHYLDGLEVFGPEQQRWFLESPESDRLHPDPQGHVIMAERFHQRLAELDVVPLRSEA